MRFAEEILLMLLDEKTGYFIPIPEWKMSCVLAGGVLMDLALENRIDTDVGTLTLIDSTPTGDNLLDPTLAEIAKETETHTPQFWVEHIAKNADAINTEALDRLSKIGILDADEGGFWNLSSKVARSGRYPLVDGRTGEEIKSRIMRTLLDDEIPDPRDIAIIGLMQSCGGIRAMLEPEEYEEAEERIELLSRMDLIGQNIGAAVESSYRPPESMRTVRYRAMPVIGVKGHAFVEDIPCERPPEILCRTSPKAWAGISAQGRWPGHDHPRRCGTEPLVQPERPAPCPFTGLYRRLSTYVGNRAVHCQHGRRRPLPHAQDGPRGQFPRGGRGSVG